jgi:ribosomal protein L21E
MPRGHGIRARTRDMLSKSFRKNGVIPMTTYLRTFKIGDYVDIKADPAIQSGMPYKVYHGRTGVIWNVTKRAVGVEVNKQARARMLCFRRRAGGRPVRRTAPRGEWSGGLDVGSRQQAGQCAGCEP